MAARWLTFDCFGTLVDWRHGIGTTGELLFPGRGADVLAAYIKIEAEVEKEKPFRRYRVVLAETLRRAAASLDLDLKHDDATALTSTIPHWPVFPDVGPALRAVHADGWKLALLTNCDRDLIALTERRLPEPFDAVITAEDVSRYKHDLGLDRSGFQQYTTWLSHFVRGNWGESLITRQRVSPYIKSALANTCRTSESLGPD